MREGCVAAGWGWLGRLPGPVCTGSLEMRIGLLSLNCESRPICLLVLEVSGDDDFRCRAQEAPIVDIAVVCSQRYVPRKAAQNCYAGRRR